MNILRFSVSGILFFLLGLFARPMLDSYLLLDRPHASVAVAQAIPTSTPTPIVIPTATPLPPCTPEPTSEPTAAITSTVEIMPSVGITSVVTPEPTSTSIFEGGISTVELDHILRSMDTMGEYVSIVRELDAHFEKMADSPELLRDATWQSGLNVLARKISLANNAVYSLPLSGRFDDVFDALREAAAHYDEVARQLRLIAIRPQTEYYRAYKAQRDAAVELTLSAYDQAKDLIGQD